MFSHWAGVKVRSVSAVTHIVRYECAVLVPVVGHYHKVAVFALVGNHHVKNSQRNLEHISAVEHKLLADKVDHTLNHIVCDECNQVKLVVKVLVEASA